MKRSRRLAHRPAQPSGFSKLDFFAVFSTAQSVRLVQTFGSFSLVSDGFARSFFAKTYCRSSSIPFLYVNTVSVKGFLLLLYKLQVIFVKGAFVHQNNCVTSRLCRTLYPSCKSACSCSYHLDFRRDGVFQFHWVSLHMYRCRCGLLYCYSLFVCPLPQSSFTLPSRSACKACPHFEPAGRIEPQFLAPSIRARWRVPARSDLPQIFSLVGTPGIAFRINGPWHIVSAEGQQPSFLPLTELRYFSDSFDDHIIGRICR